MSPILIKIFQNYQNNKRAPKESNPHLLGLESSALTIRPETH